jgi:hypothetical protein
MGGVVVAVNYVANLSNLDTTNSNIVYSDGCIFIRSSNTTSISCVDVTDWTLSSKSLPASAPFVNTNGWMSYDLAGFPDGTLAEVGAPNASIPTGTGAGQCPTGMYCKILRSYTVSGSGKNVSISFAQDYVLADTTPGWPGDNHGSASDGVYFYQIGYGSGYKVWALQSGSPSYLIFDATGSGSCGAATGISNTWCASNAAVDGLASALDNPTFMGHSPTGTYFITNWSSNKFYESYATPTAPVISISSSNLTGAVGSPFFGYTVSSTGGAVVSYAIDKALPAGLTFSTVSGRITGTPTLRSTATTYTIRATNTLGTSEATFTLNVLPLTLYVATGGTSGSGAGTSCTNPQYVGSNLATFLGGSNATIVYLCSGTFALSQPIVLTHELALSSADPNNRAVIDGQGLTRIMQIQSPGDVTISGLVFVNGNSQPSTNVSGDQASGGAILISYEDVSGNQTSWASANATYTIKNSVFNYNTTSGTLGGAIAIFGQGTPIINITNDRFAFNSAGQDGGAIGIIGNSGKITISGSIFKSNSAPRSAGALIDNFGMATINNNAFLSNTSSQGNGSTLYSGLSGTGNVIIPMQ